MGYGGGRGMLLAGRGGGPKNGNVLVNGLACKAAAQGVAWRLGGKFLQRFIYFNGLTGIRGVSVIHHRYKSNKLHCYVLLWCSYTHIVMEWGNRNLNLNYS